MLVLLSVALVLAAIVLLVLGLLNDGLALIYLSIGASVGAAIVLIVALRRNKPLEEVQAHKAPQPVPVPPADAPAATESVPIADPG